MGLNLTFTQAEHILAEKQLHLSAPKPLYNPATSLISDRQSRVKNSFRFSEKMCSDDLYNEWLYFPTIIIICFLLWLKIALINMWSLRIAKGDF